MVYTDQKGYLRNRHGRLIHRKVAYKKIYLKDREMYYLPFRMYVVHHKNGNKKDNRLKNLEIIFRSDHEIHHDKNGDGCDSSGSDEHIGWWSRFMNKLKILFDHS